MNLQGWDAAIAGNIPSWLGVEGDFSGHYGSPSVGPFDVPYVNVRIHSFMGGPKLQYRGNPWLTPYAHLLIGVAHAGAGAFRFGLGEGSRRQPEEGWRSGTTAASQRAPRRLII